MYTMSYSYNSETGTLTLSKNAGNKQIQLYVDSWEASDFGLSSINTLVFDESIDEIKAYYINFEGQITNETIPLTQQYLIDLVFAQDSYYIMEYRNNPKKLINQSMRSFICPIFYYLTNNGKRIEFDYSTFEYEANYQARQNCPSDESMTDAEREQWIKNETERIAVREFNNTYSTNFQSANECRAFVVKEVEFYPVMSIYCKRNSAQEAFCKEVGANYILLDDSTSKVDSRTSAKATYNNSAFNTPVSLSINKVNSGKDSVVSYNITPTDENGNKIQPNEAMEISLPIPDGWNENDLQVRHEKDDGTTENLEFVVDDNNAVFYTSSCSIFSLVNTAGISAGEQTDEPTTEEPTTEPSTQPQKEDTKQNLNFFQRIIQWFKNLFAKLFRR